MAKYRHVHTTFWQDPKVTEELTPEDRYFYLYLITNPNTTQIGIYPITKKQMAFDLGYSIESVNSLMDRFVNHHKLILYNNDTREMAIKNWPKYNLNKGGKPILDCVTKELRDVKDKSLMKVLYPKIENTNIRDLFERYADDTLHDTSTTSGQKEKEKEKEKEKKDILSGNPTVNPETQESEIPFKLIVDLLNKVTGKSFRHTSAATQRLIKARWNDGFRFEDFKTVILTKTNQWLKDDKMNKYLQPTTLFGTKFEGYLNEGAGVIKNAEHQISGGRVLKRKNDLPF
ncbi:conserved phage C-terminal domain-containing protein [Bacillus altitudinis]|uniref:conserved phage C-terminal domain-containing protein n=1 Tax=Bacillus altitudinis TaxID=293387 RepID=UPI00227ECF64|nr:conserved phage C-terminal domain-containing protein [Bacillus altitudinis]MCY7628219.1 conserved phage C-terminal domain-containing protein [Bacillus altitudinis]